MSTATSITVDLEHAKRLKEAGWPQEDSYWTWWRGEETGYFNEGKKWRIIPQGSFHAGLRNERAAAPTAEEILRRLPSSINHDGEEYYFSPEFYGNPIHYGDVQYRTRPRIGSKNLGGVSFEWTQTYADGLSEMWIYLKEQNLLPS